MTAFLGLAVFIGGQIIVTLALGIRPDSSPLGIAWLAATVVAMYALAAAILVGLALNAALGWWWADLAGGIILIGYGLREGLHALRDPH